jgi:L-seryl-tRNA(Ser) seleniumtransferase
LTVPVLRMVSHSIEDVERRAERLAERLHGRWRVALMSGASTIGGGSAPGVELPTVLVALEHPDLSPDALEVRLRELTPPVIARIEADRVVLDLRTVFEEQDETLAESLLQL